MRQATEIQSHGSDIRQTALLIAASVGEIQ
jgi:hypothetical protein